MNQAAFSDNEITGDALTEPRKLIARYETDHRHTVTVNSLEEASEHWQASIAEGCFGASEVGSCDIYEGSKVVARISYNGRVWAV